MEDLTGKQLGRYQIVAALSEGGMAVVYKAYQPGMDRYVALKILPRHFASDPEFLGRFKQEAKVIAKLQHVHILQVHDFGEDDGYTYIVMPFVETGTLADLLHDKPLSLRQIRKFVSQVGDALSYAHSRGLVHRDIKPSNILIDDRENCLLTDFGIAKIVEGTTKFTQTGAIIGTPAYMSPEQILGETLDGRSDIYSLGIVLYEMSTGRPPYRAETPPAIYVKHLYDPLPPPRTLNPDLPEPLERVILKSLTKERKDRYATAVDMVQAIRAAIPAEAPDEAILLELDEVPLPAVVEEEETRVEIAPPPLEKPVVQVEEPIETLPRRKPPWWTFALGAMALLAVVGGILLAPRLIAVFGQPTSVATTILPTPEQQTPVPTPMFPTPEQPTSVPTNLPVTVGVTVKWTYIAPEAIWYMDSWGDGLATGDLNDDGISDIALGTASGYVIVVDGANAQELWSYRITTQTSAPVNVDVVDVNDDGVLDVIATGKGDSTSQGKAVICALDRNSTRMWQVQGEYEEVVDLAYGDIDGDGDTDVVASVGTYSWGGGQVLLLDGATGSRVWSQSLGSGHPQGIDVGDVDGDGEVEIVVENYDNKVFLLDGKTGDILWSRDKAWYGRDVIIADVDDDGTQEIISGAGNVTAFNPKGDQEWAAVPEQEGFNISSGDVNGDGHDEVVFSSAFPGILTVLDGHGSMLWYRSRSGVHAIGDVNGDGVDDIITATIRFYGIEPPYSIDAVDGSNNTLWSYPLDTIYNEGGFGLATANLDSDPALEVLVANGTQLMVLDATD